MFLVIVESPSKCNTIQKYLGNDYRVIATCGHFRSLNKLEQIDFDSFSVKYETDKPKIVKLLKEESQKADEVIIATDDDREGEAIGWHICQVCKLSPDKTKRIIFHEITESGIRHAIENPTYLNMNRVYSQNTRQILDLYIGFKVSPILWKYVQHKLSAGRCQTPALHLIYEQEMKISSQSYQDTHIVVKGYFTKNCIEFNLEKSLTKSEIIPFLTSLNNHEFVLLPPITKEQTISPPKIFTTSSLQQFANNVLHMSPQQTMRSAQILYEKGLITYMRTDTAVYSNEFINKIKKHLGDDFSQPLMDNSNNGNQAHEGIRITNLIIQDITINDSYAEKLYKYIYKHTLQTCMKPAVMFHKIYSTKCPNDLCFQYTDSTLKFPGWKKLDHEKNNVTSYSNYLDYLNNISLLKVLSTERCIHPSFHWTESQLVNQLEKRDIGRPSTYTSILESILTKKYVSLGKIVGQELKLKKYEFIPNQDIIETEEVKIIEESHKLSLTKLGREVDEFCYKHFSDLFNYDYTTRMETQLDMIEKGEVNWKTTLQEFISHVNSYLTIKDEMPKQYNSLHAGIYKKHAVVIKDGPHGYYIEYNKECHSLEYFENISMIPTWIEQGEISSDELNALISYIENKTNPNIIVEINQNWSLRTGKYGKYLYYKTSKMKAPKFYKITIDTENKNELEDYIIKKYKNI
jgi:DNA topoisomerase-1